MCLILFAYKTHPHYPLVLLANRDEFYHRPTAQAAFWKDNESVLAGRDLEAGGTWMGIHRNGNLAALTNFRSADQLKKFDRSRGDLVSGFLRKTYSPMTFIEEIKKHDKVYAGYNLLLGNINNLFAYSNINGQVHQIRPGVHGLSNRFLNSDWPKVTNGKLKLKNLMNTNQFTASMFLEILQNTEIAMDDSLPETGFSIEMERMLSATFIKSENYGTRSSTVLIIDEDNNVDFSEWSYDRGDQSDMAHYQFKIQSD